MQMLTGWLRQQSTHTGIVFLALLVLVARAAGIDLALLAEDVAKDVATLAAVVGTISAAAKVALPDVPPQPPAAQAADKLAEIAREMAGRR